MEEIKPKTIDDVVIYEKLWNCRNFEIEHYWHRMVFMTAFLVLIFASYGGFIISWMKADSRLPFMVGNYIAIFIVLIGFLLSSLWIMMSKGSKAWYEEYEHVIGIFLKDRKDACFSGLAYEKIKEPRSFKISNSLFNTKAGSYSVSKIGIAIGHLAMVIWVSLGIAHFWMIASCTSFEDVESSLAFITWKKLLLIVIFVCLFFYIYVKLQLYSGYFLNNKKKCYCVKLKIKEISSKESSTNKE